MPTYLILGYSLLLIDTIAGEDHLPLRFAMMTVYFILLVFRQQACLALPRLLKLLVNCSSIVVAVNIRYSWINTTVLKVLSMGVYVVVFVGTRCSVFLQHFLLQFQAPPTYTQHTFWWWFCECLCPHLPAVAGMHEWLWNSRCLFSGRLGTSGSFGAVLLWYSAAWCVWSDYSCFQGSA